MVKENMLRLKGTENDGYIHKYYFNKVEKFKLWFFDFMKELGFDEEYYKYDFENYSADGKDDLKELEVKEMNQFSRTFRNEDFDVEVIYFEDEIVFIVRTENRNKLIELANKYMKFKDE